MNRRAFFGTLFAGYVAARWPWSPRPQDLGISIRFIREFNVTTHAVHRLDVLYGWAQLRPEFACRMTDEDPLAWLKTRMALRCSRTCARSSGG